MCQPRPPHGLGGAPPARHLAGEPAPADTGAVKQTVQSLTASLLDSYARVGGINHVDGKNLPSKRAIAGLTRDLLRLLFPGFFDETVLHSEDLPARTAELLALVAGRLEVEIRKSFEATAAPGEPRRDAAERARQVTCEFLEQLPAVRTLLATDVEAAFHGDPAAFSPDEVILAYPCIEAIAVQRLAHRLYLREVPLIPRIMTEWAHSRTGMDFHPGARIGSHFFVDHGTGTVIGETTEIGNHVRLYQGVGLVARSLSGGQALRGKKRHPTLEDRVTVYAGATIMGGDTVVGAGSTIGANVFLTHSVPPHSLVLSGEAAVKVLPKPERAGSADYQI